MESEWWPAPEAGDIVWCHFPIIKGIEPRLKPRPALIIKVFDDQAPCFIIQVVYGTRQKTEQIRSGEFLISKSHLSAYKLAGLSYSTNFSFRNKVELLYNKEWFKVPPGEPNGKTPKLGVLHPSLMPHLRTVYEAAHKAFTIKYNKTLMQTLTSTHFQKLSIMDPVCVIEAQTTLQAGFPSPASDDEIKRIDLNEVLIKNPAHTVFISVRGHSMIEAGIDDGDKVIVDRQIKPCHGHIVVAQLEDSFTIKRLYKKNGQIKLVPANSNYSEISFNKGQELIIFGVVTYAIKAL